MNNIDLFHAIQEFRHAFLIGVGDKSPFAKQALQRIDSAVELATKRDQKDSRVWVMVAMTLFTISKIAALYFAVYIAVNKSLWVGVGLFVVSLVYRITWSYLSEKQKGGEGTRGAMWSVTGKAGEDLKKGWAVQLDESGNKWIKAVGRKKENEND